MDENEFRKAYAEMERGIVADDALKERAKSALRTTSPASSCAVRWRRTAASKVLAACLAVIAGVGILAGSIMLMRAPAPLSAEGFDLIAFADEAPREGAQRSVGLGIDKFHPVRSRAGYPYDQETDSTVTEVASADRYYQMDLTVGGEGISSVCYEIRGEDVSFGYWGKDGSGQGNVLEGDSASSFMVSAPEGDPTFREIRLNYVFTDEEKSEFDALYDARDVWGMETFLAKCDAARLATATLTVTATFEDGSSASKAYGFVPEDNYEVMYESYLKKLDGELGDAWLSLADEPSLFRLVETSSSSTWS